MDKLLTVAGFALLVATTAAMVAAALLTQLYLGNQVAADACSRRRASVDSVGMFGSPRCRKSVIMRLSMSIAMRWLASAGTAPGNRIPLRSALRIRLPEGSGPDRSTPSRE